MVVFARYVALRGKVDGRVEFRDVGDGQIVEEPYPAVSLVVFSSRGRETHLPTL